MAYYSQLIGKPIIDKNQNKIGYVSDLSFMDKTRYALISGIVVEINKHKEIIPWKYVLEIGGKSENPFPLGIYLNQEFEKIAFHQVNERTLKQVVDKQLMDINGARVIRVNDILLGQTGKKFIIVGVDISTKSLLRRLGFGFIASKKENEIILWKDVAPLSDDIKGLKLKVKRDRINKLHPAEIADIIRDLNLEEKEMIFNSLNKQKAAETLLTSQPSDQQAFFKTLPLRKLAKMLETLPEDDAAAILNMMPSVHNTKILRLMKLGIASRIKKVLSYDKRSAGFIMSTEFLSIPEGLKVKEAIKYIKKEMPNSNFISYLYVKGKDNTLKGIISLRDLIIADPNTVLNKIVRTDIFTVNEHFDIDDVFNLMSKYKLLALPVLDKDKKIVGVIRVNDILDIMIPKNIKKQRISRHKKLNHKTLINNGNKT